MADNVGQVLVVSCSSFLSSEDIIRGKRSNFRSNMKNFIFSVKQLEMCSLHLRFLSIIFILNSMISHSSFDRNVQDRIFISQRAFKWQFDCVPMENRK